MKKREIASAVHLLLPVVGASLFLSSVQAEDILWNLTFDEMKPGTALEAGPFDPPCEVPQKTYSDAANTLIVEAKSGDLGKNPLVFKKANTERYMPCFELSTKEEYSSGIVTVEWEFTIDELTFNAVNAQKEDLEMETLLTFAIYNSPGGAAYRVSAVGKRGDELALNTEGFTDATHGRGPKLKPFSAGEIMRVKIVLNLSEQKAQVFVNDEPFTEELQGDKFGIFHGFRVGDGTAVGGNYGSTFTASIDNIKISHQ